MNLEIVSGVFEKLVVPHIPQIIPSKKPVPTTLACKLRDVKGQISQGQKLLDSGRSLNPEQLRAQLKVLNEQRAGLLPQKGE